MRASACRAAGYGGAHDAVGSERGIGDTAVVADEQDVRGAAVFRPAGDHRPTIGVEDDRLGDVVTGADGRRDDAALAKRAR